MSEVRILPRALQRIGVSGRVTGTIGSPMADPLVTVASLLAPAFDQVAGRSGVDPVVRPSDRAHAQANGALPAHALEDLIGQVRELDMDEVRRQIAEQTPAS